MGLLILNIFLFAVVAGCLGAMIGKIHTSNKVTRKLKTDDIARTYLDSEVSDAKAWMGGICFMLFLVGIYFILSFLGYRNSSIDKWRNHEIIEELTYTYTQIDSVKTPADSSSCYIKNPSK